jgi:hypothetical protein
MRAANAADAREISVFEAFFFYLCDHASLVCLASNRSALQISPGKIAAASVKQQF